MTISEYRESRQPRPQRWTDPDSGLEEGLADDLDHASGGLDPLSRAS
jgi:hypothetical protein